MKKVIFLLISFMATFGFAQSADKAAKTPEQKASHHSEMLTKKLSLSPEQKQSVYTLILDRVNKANAVRAKYTTGDKKGMHKELKPIIDDFNTKIKAILTPDQVTKWEQFKAEKKAKRKEAKEANATDDGIDN
jgi:periplasmic protein CpxP/Spy